MRLTVSNGFSCRNSFGQRGQFKTGRNRALSVRACDTSDAGAALVHRWFLSNAGGVNIKKDASGACPQRKFLSPTGKGEQGSLPVSKPANWFGNPLEGRAGVTALPPNSLTRPGVRPWPVEQPRRLPMHYRAWAGGAFLPCLRGQELPDDPDQPDDGTGDPQKHRGGIAQRPPQAFPTRFQLAAAVGRASRLM